jgi:aldose 1-epimerase
MIASDAEPLVLRCGDATLMLCPAIGGAVARYQWRGYDILRPASDTAIRDQLVRQMGCYPLLPYSNRIGHGRFEVGGVVHTLRANFAPEPHAVHGFAWQRRWHVTRQNAQSAHLELHHTPDADWPFACDARQAIALSDNGCTLQLGVTNSDTRVMPAGLGFHPYFVWRDGMTLATNWTGMWTMNDKKLPADLVSIPPEADFAHQRAVAGWHVDHCFAGWSRDAVLDYQTHRVQINASEACDHVVCYVPKDGHSFIAIEPATHANNALQRTPDAMRWLQPGESFEIAMKLSITAGANELGDSHA